MGDDFHEFRVRVLWLRGKIVIKETSNLVGVERKSSGVNRINPLAEEVKLVLLLYLIAISIVQAYFINRHACSNNETCVAVKTFTENSDINFGVP